MLRKLSKILLTLALCYLLLALATPFSQTLRNRSISNQLTYLSNILDLGHDDELQNRFPEGKLFSNALLAVSTVEYYNKQEKAAKKYAKIVDNCILRLQSESALESFHANMIPAYGMFYNGWSNYVYATYKKSPLFEFSSVQELVISESKIIEERLLAAQSDSLRMMDSYIESNWPADNMMGIISLSNSELQEAWINFILQSTEHSSGLVHHSGSDPTEVRGSSSAMITYCMSVTEHPATKAYAGTLRSTFIDEYLGVQLVKEHVDGSGGMDADSGPILFGYGASATIMNIRTQARLGNPKSKATWAAMNLIGLPINIFGRKYYLLKKEPMLDLFMLWTSVAL